MANTIESKFHYANLLRLLDKLLRVFREHYKNALTFTIMDVKHTILPMTRRQGSGKDKGRSTPNVHELDVRRTAGLCLVHFPKVSTQQRTPSESNRTD